MIGIMSIDHNIMYTHKCSTLLDDKEEGAMVSEFTAGDSKVYDVVSATRA